MQKKQYQRLGKVFKIDKKKELIIKKMQSLDGKKYNRSILYYDRKYFTKFVNKIYEHNNSSFTKFVDKTHEYDDSSYNSRYNILILFFYALFYFFLKKNKKQKE